MGAPAPLILVVDDYEDNRVMYAEYLRYAGFRVEEAGDGITAVAKAKELAPDLMILDLSLPRLDGWSVARSLRSDPRTPRMPIVALTGFALSTHGAQAMAAGCDAFMVKPCLPADLLACVQSLLQKASRRG